MKDFINKESQCASMGQRQLYAQDSSVPTWIHARSAGASPHIRSEYQIGLREVRSNGWTESWPSNKQRNEKISASARLLVCGITL